MKIVLSADLHLGRTSTRLPEIWRDAGRSIRAWERLVDAVIAEQADLLCLSGDILDHRNQLWEAMGPLQAGIQKLHQAGIRTLAVSGNHDASSLPELAAQFPEQAFTLLGKKGTWQRVKIQNQGQSCLYVDGWSFPASKVNQDPTLHYPGASSSDGIPVLAMVHGDPGVPDSSYAPLSISHLQSLPVNGWLLGHIHRPHFTPGSPWVLMPGSPHPLDPGEPGDHHAWICHLDAGVLSPPEPFCPAILRYEQIDIQISPQDVPSIDGIRKHIQSAVDALPSTLMNVLRIRLCGRVTELDAWQACCENLDAWAPGNFIIESVTFDLHPAIDLNEASQTGPVQALLVQALDHLPEDLQARLHKRCEQINRQNEYAGKELPEIALEQLPVSAQVEAVLQKAMEQMS